jgi:solute carrier family 50 protein (sugar transporter)
MTSNKDTLTPLVEKICTVSTIGLFLTGVQICNRIYRMNTTGDISGFPFVATLVNCTLWLLYGYTANNSTIMIVNFIGASLQMLYALTYLRYTPDRTTYLRLIGSAVLFLAFVAFYLQYFVPNRETAVLRAGLFASVATVIMFGSPLATFRDIVQKQSTESLSFPLCFANFIVPIEWVLYGILINDKFVQVPNFLGAILGFIQVSLFFKYPRQSGLLPKATNLGGI